MSDGIDYNTVFASLGAGGSVFTIVLGSLQLKSILRARRLRREREERAKAEKNNPRPGEMHGAIYIPTDEEVRKFQRHSASFSAEQNPWPSLRSVLSKASDLHINIMIALITSLTVAVVANEYLTSQTAHYSMPKLIAEGPSTLDYDAIVYAVEIYHRTKPDGFIITSEGYKLIYNGEESSESNLLELTLQLFARHMQSNSVFFEITHYLPEFDESDPASLYILSTPDGQSVTRSTDPFEQRTRFERDDLMPRSELLIRNLDD